MNIVVNNPADVLMESIENSCALPQYTKTLDLSSDISRNEAYQKNYVGYYRVRRDAAWLKEYFTFMEAHKNDRDLSFREILAHLSSIPHNSKNGMICSLEVSFSSKMIATINSDYPIWDSQVIKAIGLKEQEHSVDGFVVAYDALCHGINDYINSPQGEACIREFDAKFPRYTWVSKAKKIDFFLWNLGK